MRQASLSLLAYLCLSLCAAGRCADEEYKPSITLHRIEKDAAIEGKWSFTDKWRGYMGLSFEFRNGEFKYWFYSDVKSDNEPEYPITGTYKIEHGVLRLGAKEHVYATAWILITYDGKKGLFPLCGLETIVTRREAPDMRMLYRVSERVTDRHWPILNAPTEIPDPKELSLPTRKQ